jgi:hypothetical protein
MMGKPLPRYGHHASLIGEFRLINVKRKGLFPFVCGKEKQLPTKPLLSGQRINNSEYGRRDACEGKGGGTTENAPFFVCTGPRTSV